MSVPIDLGREPAAELARQELAKQVYREAGPSLTERVLGWVIEHVSRWLERAAEVSPGGYGGLVVALLLLVAAAVAVRLRLGPLRRATAESPALFTGEALTAAEHRRRADAHASAGEWAEAVRERLRAVARELEARTIIAALPGRTADEMAVQAGRALPELAADLQVAARLFDDVWYGGRPAGPEADRALRALDAAVAAARPVLPAAPDLSGTRR